MDGVSDPGMRQTRRHGLVPVFLNLALGLLAAGAIVSVASSPAAQSPPAGPPPFAPAGTSGPALAGADGGLDGGSPPVDGGSTLPEAGAAPQVGAPPAPPAPPAPGLADGGSPEGGSPGAEPSSASGASASGAPASAGDPADSTAAEGGGGAGSGRILNPKKIYVSIPVALGVSAGVNFAMGIAFTVLSNAKVAKTEGIWRELRTDGGPGACTRPGFAARCDELYEADGDRHTYRNMAVLSYLGALGFALGGGVSYFILFKGSEGKVGGSSALVVDIRPSGGGAAIKGTF
jgi:hypothetical protein